MSGEVQAAIVGAVVGAVLGALLPLGVNYLQALAAGRGKLRSSSALLWMELSDMHVKLDIMEPSKPKLFDVLADEVWKAVRLDMAALLKDYDLFETLCTISLYVDGWNLAVKSSTAKADVLADARKTILSELDKVMPRLKILGGMGMMPDRWIPSPSHRNEVGA